MKIASWNVNGLRACVQKGFADWVRGAGLFALGIQELRALPDQVPEEALAPGRLKGRFFPAEKGYSGVGFYAKNEPDDYETSMGEAKFDVEGRYQSARFGKLRVVNVYVPNGTGPNRDLSRIPYKLAFSRLLFDLLEKEKKRGGRILVMGDFNTAHEEIDLARPKDNVKNSGFRPEERAEFSRWIGAGWVDTFRRFHPGAPGHYTWWTQRGGARERNVGWRIDYVLASPAAMKFVKAASIHPGVMSSDHCPIGVTLDPAILK